MGSNNSAPRYSRPSSLLGSEDPSMVKESEDLLSQFMRCSSHEAQDSHQRENPLLDNQRLSTTLPVGSLSPRPRVRIPRGSVQIRPQSSPRSPNVSTRTPADLKVSTKQTVVLPTSRTKPPTPPRKQTPQPPSPVSDVPKPGVTRRSGRLRAGPTNYYKKLHIFDSESEEEVQVVQEVTNSRSLPRHQRHSTSSAATPTPPAPASQTTRGRNTSVGLFLQQRELGRNQNQQLYSKLTSDFKLTKAWKGASNDVVALAWSPDGTRFAAGATAQCDEHMMAYNRKNNLLLGDLVSNELHELADHWVQRPRGRSSSSDVVNDPRLFMSVTALQWFEDTLYTASYDHTVKIWDTSKGHASCFKTLRHDSKVVVMARSNFAENLLATGTNTIGLWDVEEAQYTKLELPRAKIRKDIELVPTSVAWGPIQATKDYLLAGMSEKEDGNVASHGLLAAFRVREAFVEPEYFTPNSQNIFDVRWHPVLPTFATACTAGQQASRGTRSVVNLYEPLRLKSRVMEFECPALDMNEVVFCPLNTNYISASCTDGATYVWDQRNSGQVLHRLKHGDPLNQLDETIPREQADTGVNLQLWGSTCDQFYTGASDGVLKRWDIFRAPEDVLVKDVATLQEGVMCGAFSKDKSNLLIGDVSGGIHLLSNSPFSSEEADELIFKESPHVIEQETNFESSVGAARELLLSGQIERHPVFGPGQGPYYKGPFAAWARADGTPPERMAQTPLAEKYEIRQLCGLWPKYRKGLSPALRRDVEAHISLARMRNQKRGEKKRRNLGRTGSKTVAYGDGNFIDLCSDDDGDGPGYEVSAKRRQPISKFKLPGFVIKSVKAEIIDLTGESDPEDLEENPRSSGSYPRKDPNAPKTGLDELDDLDEDDFWWPDSRTINPNITDPDS